VLLLLAACHVGRDPDAPGGTPAQDQVDAAGTQATTEGDGPSMGVATSPSSSVAGIADPQAGKTTDPTSAPRTKFTRPQEWPSDVVFPLEHDPKWIRPVVGEAGDVRIELTLTTTDVAGPLADWRRALADAGYEERAPCEVTERSARCGLFGQNRRGLLLLTRPTVDPERVHTSLHLYPSGHEPVASLPGACVKPPEVSRRFESDVSGIDQEGESFFARLGYVVGAWDAVDLDGDGVLDRFVPRPKGGRCPWEVTFDVYVMRGECGHLVGSVTGDFAQESHVAGFVRGLRAITTRSEWATHGSKRPLPEHHSRTRRYVFDGKQLRERSDDTRTGVCHHCGVASCRELPGDAH
jgi:hypothetical protein